MSRGGEIRTPVIPGPKPGAITKLGDTPLYSITETFTSALGENRTRVHGLEDRYLDPLARACPSSARCGIRTRTTFRPLAPRTSVYTYSTKHACDYSVEPLSRIELEFPRYDGGVLAIETIEACLPGDGNRDRIRLPQDDGLVTDKEVPVSAVRLEGHLSQWGQPECPDLPVQMPPQVLH